MNAFDQLVAAKQELEQEVETASKALQAFPRGSMGLTPDSVKASPEWKAARNRYQLAADKVRGFNARFIKSHGRQWREYLHAQRGTR